MYAIDSCAPHSAFLFFNDNFLWYPFYFENVPSNFLPLQNILQIEQNQIPRASWSEWRRRKKSQAWKCTKRWYQQRTLVCRLYDKAMTDAHILYDLTFTFQLPPFFFISRTHFKECFLCARFKENWIDDAYRFHSNQCEHV